MYLTAALCEVKELIAEPLVVVAAKDSTLKELSKSQIQKIYLGKVKTLPSGDAIVPLDQNNEKLKRKFYSKVIGKNGSALKAYWARLIFTGRGQPPQQLIDDNDVINFVKEEKTSIGYISLSSVDDSLIILYKVP